jgi:hypothetical protein
VTNKNCTGDKDTYYWLILISFNDVISTAQVYRIYLVVMESE